MEKTMGQKIKITNHQQVVSVSLCSNIDGFTEPHCIVSETPSELFQLMFLRLDEMTQKAGQNQKLKYKELSDKIENIQEKSFREKTMTTLERYVYQVPVVGFNSGKYDINLNINDFMKELIQRDPNIFSIKSGNTYKSLSTANFLFLDMSQYLPPNYDLDQYIKAFNPNGLKKSVFPYEFLDSYEKLDFDIHKLERKHFHSKLKNGGINLLQWDEFEKNRDKLGWKTLRDLLIHYNNLDVQPFLEAIINHKKFFYREVEIDMFKDGMSLPGLAEKVMFNYSLQDFETDYLNIKEPPNTNYSIPLSIDERLLGYMQQDEKTSRYNPEKFIQRDEVENIFHKHHGNCHYCWNPCKSIDWSLDRLDNSIGHNEGNCVLSCIQCNRQRSNTPYKIFYRKKALLRYDKDHPLIHLIDKENSEVYYKLKQNITGGASIVFHRYHEAEKTKIKRPVYRGHGKWEIGKEGKTVKQIVGFDANALYLWGIAQSMLCGVLKYQTYDEEEFDIDKFLENFHGMVEVDIHTLEHLKQYFSEFPLVFKNIEYDANEVMGDCIKELYSDQKEKRMTKKLISSFSGEKVLIKADRLRFMISKGMVVTKIHGFIKAEKGKIFEKFAQKVSDERRKGDIDPNHAIIAEMWKLIGNSAFGRTGMDKSKFRKTEYCDESKFYKKVSRPTFKDANQYGDVFEITSQYRKISLNMPIQVACSIYDDSKLKMSQFYYDFVDKYLSRDDYQYIQMDTDSSYMALTADFEDLIKPELIDEYKKDRINWFLRNDNVENYKYDKRVPGLFKPEFFGAGIVALASKTYFVKGFDKKESKYDRFYVRKDKFSCKAIQHKHNCSEITFDRYKSVLLENAISKVTNKGMRILNDKQVFDINSEVNQNRRMYGYEIEKVGLSGKYDKRVVLDDKVSTVPLDL